MTASRVVLLVSDGGATIKEDNREKLSALFAERHASLIWIYTRGDDEPSILAPRRSADTDSLSLHEFFGAHGQSPYEMFEVTSPEGLEHAVSRSRSHDQPADALRGAPAAARSRRAAVRARARAASSC